MRRKIIIIISLFFIIVLTFVATEFLIVKYNGTPVQTSDIPRGSQTLGSGPQLTYLVMGDSTSVGVGTDYNHSYALASAKHLAKTHKVKFINTGISGATAKSVLDDQLTTATSYKPDIVLLAVGANDATHRTSGKVIKESIQQVIDDLKNANCDVRIVVTGSPAMDSVDRFRWPLRQYMGLRTRQVNNVFSQLVDQNHLTFALIAEKTRADFLADPTLFAKDKFHPNNRGYALWTPVINNALDKALKSPPSKNCQK